jgi:hypothetical protein
MRRFLLTDHGVWPRTLVLQNADPQVHPSKDGSIYMGVGSIFWASTCLILASFAATGVMLGAWTHTCLFICWLHLYSLTYRGSATHQAGDTLLRLLLFWLFFLPCERHFSVDQYLSSGTYHHDHHQIVSIASVGVLVQMSMLYVFPAAFKTAKAWREGTAITYVLKNFAFSKQNIVTEILLHQRICGYRLAYFLSLTTPWVEHAAPLLLLFAPLRWIGVVVFVSFHIGLMLTMRLGLFPFVCIAGWVIVLPEQYWPIDDTQLHQQPLASQAATASLLEWYLSLLPICVVVIIQWIIQGCALWLSIACNVNTLPQKEPQSSTVATSVLYVDAMILEKFQWTKWMQMWFDLDQRKGLYDVARILGVQQQWFLFDNPPRRSFWFRIVGTTVKTRGEKSTTTCTTTKSTTETLKEIAKETAKETAKAEEGVKSYDLHRMTLWCEKNDGFLSTKKQLMQVPDLIYIPVTDEEHHMGGNMSFEHLYGTHRYRKMFQRLTEQRQRFTPFTTTYSQFLQRQWREIGLEKKYGMLSTVTCFGCWVPLQCSPLQCLSSTDGKNHIPSISRAKAWEIQLCSGV